MASEARIRGCDDTAAEDVTADLRQPEATW